MAELLKEGSYKPPLLGLTCGITTCIQRVELSVAGVGATGGGMGRVRYKLPVMRCVGCGDPMYNVVTTIGNAALCD